MKPQEIWEAALGEIELSISEANFNTWLKNTLATAIQGDQIIIAVPNVFNKEWLEKKYHDLILKTLHHINHQIRQVKYVVQTPPAKIFDQKARPLAKKQLEIRAGFRSRGGLNPRYHFENFVVGPFNELAHAAALSVANNLGKKFNPLFIYGGVGLGKTHLLQAIGNKVCEKYPNKRVKYISSEKFTSDLIKAIQNQTIDQFKDRYRRVDILIIDDIQFIAGKEKTQEEFFHTFNHLYERNKQIVISSDRPPKSIPTLESRLRSRFEGGMTADISYPDFETRMAILRKKAEECNFLASEKILVCIANKISRNIRELEGALNRIMTLSELNQTALTPEEVEKVIMEFSSSSKKVTSFPKIVDVVASYYDLKKEDILNKSRKKEIAYPRQIIMYLLREELDNSFPAIGRKLGGRDHTTVMYAYKKIKHRIQQNEEFRQEIDLIKERIYNY